MQTDPRNPNEGENPTYYTPPQTTISGHIPQQYVVGQQPQQVVIGQQQPQVVVGPDGQQVFVMHKPPSDELIIAVWVLSGCAILLSPLTCGLAAIVCAAISMSQNHPKGKKALIIAIICPIVGLMIQFGILFALMYFEGIY